MSALERYPELQDFYYTKAKLTSIIDNNINRYYLFGSLCLGIGSDKLFCFSIPWDDGAGKGVRSAKKRPAVSSPSLSCRKRDDHTSGDDL